MNNETKKIESNSQIGRWYPVRASPARERSVKEKEIPRMSNIANFFKTVEYVRCIRVNVAVTRKNPNERKSEAIIPKSPKRKAVSVARLIDNVPEASGRNFLSGCSLSYFRSIMSLNKYDADEMAQNTMKPADVSKKRSSSNNLPVKIIGE